MCELELKKLFASWFGILYAIPTMADDFKTNVVLGAINALMLLLNAVAVYDPPPAQNGDCLRITACPLFAKRQMLASHNQASHQRDAEAH